MLNILFKLSLLILAQVASASSKHGWWESTLGTEVTSFDGFE
jgi:hypothetical protein